MDSWGSSCFCCFYIVFCCSCSRFYLSCQCIHIFVVGCSSCPLAVAMFLVFVLFLGPSCCALWTYSSWFPLVVYSVNHVWVDSCYQFLLRWLLIAFCLCVHPFHTNYAWVVGLLRACWACPRICMVSVPLFHPSPACVAYEVSWLLLSLLYEVALACFHCRLVCCAD